jgi:PIN domain nuclease of toxin-antitoxin system
MLLRYVRTKEKEAPALSQGFVENGAAASILRQVRTRGYTSLWELRHIVTSPVRLLTSHHNDPCTRLYLMTAMETAL